MKNALCLVGILTILCVSACNGKEAALKEGSVLARAVKEAPAEATKDVAGEASDSQFAENPIERAFERVLKERREELEGNAAFSYLYALAWQDEYYLLKGKFGDEDSLEASGKASPYAYSLKEAAFQYAQEWSGWSKEAAVLMEGIARFYRLLTWDVLARLQEKGVGAVWQTNEEELYLRLNGLSYEPSIPDKLDRSYAEEVLADEGNPMPVFAALKKEDVHLAFAEPFGAVLSIKGKEYLYPWSDGMLTPRAVLPRISISDYDGDGEEEVAVILYTGSGTGVSLEELYLVGMDGTVGMEDSLTAKEVERLLFHRISASYDPKAKEVVVTLDGDELRVDASWAEMERKEDFRGVEMQNRIGFDQKDAKLSVHGSIELCNATAVSPFGYVNYYADIVFDKDRPVSLANVRLEKGEP